MLVDRRLRSISRPKPIGPSRRCYPVHLSASILLLLTACATPVQVERVDPRVINRELTSNVVSTGNISEPTQIVLDREGLAELFEADPERALSRLHRVVVSENPDADGLFALSELSFLHADDTGKPAYYLASAVYAFAFLFPDDPAQRPGRFDPRVRIASDLYNRGLTSAFASPDRSRVLLQSGRYKLPFGSIDITFDPRTARWGNLVLSDFTPVMSCTSKDLRTATGSAGSELRSRRALPPQARNKGFRSCRG